MIPNKIASIAVCIALSVVLGCGGGSATKAGPKGPVDGAQLIGTTWKDAESVSYTFKDAKNVDVTTPSQPTPIEGTYTVEQGVVNIDAMMIKRDGTWDGKSLVFDDKPLTKQ
jgi:hypothetical protein